MIGKTRETGSKAMWLNCITDKYIKGNQWNAPLGKMMSFYYARRFEIKYL